MAPRFPTRLLLRHLLQSPPVPARHHSTAAALVPKLHPFTHPLFNFNRSTTAFNFNHYPQHPILRFLSTRPGRATRPQKPDIGARARQLQARRLWNYAGIFTCMSVFVAIVINQFQDQMVFYVTPTEALEKYNSDPTKAKFRLGGLVLENSIVQIPSSPETQFVITDLITDILVKYEGSLPDLFREGHSAIVEGFVRPLDEETKRKEEAALKSSSKYGATEKARTLECYFAAVDVLAKHDEKYMPAEVYNAIEKNKKLLKEQEQEKAAALSNASDGDAAAKA